MAFCDVASSGCSDSIIEYSNHHQYDTYQEPVKAPHVDRHAEWVKKDAERHHRIEAEYERGWAEDYMDEHDW